MQTSGRYSQRWSGQGASAEPCPAWGCARAGHRGWQKAGRQVGPVQPHLGHDGGLNQRRQLGFI